MRAVGQLVAGHEILHQPADAIVTVGGAIPYFRNYRRGGMGLYWMGSVIVPSSTAVMVYLPKPAFGAPGARTLMREWAKMVRTPDVVVDRIVE